MGPSSSNMGAAVSPPCSDRPLLFLPAARNYVHIKKKGLYLLYRPPALLDTSPSARALKLAMPEHPPQLAEDLANAPFDLLPLLFPGPPPTTSLHHLPRSQLILLLLQVEESPGHCPQPG